MSIAGIISNEALLDDADLRACLNRLAHTPDTAQQLIHLESATLGAVNDAVSWRGGPAAAGCAAVFDGMLFERTALSERLGADPSGNDAQLAVLAYLRWGDAFADELDGKFAAAVWDPKYRRLVLARDAIGRVPLHFSRMGNSLFFASEPRGLAGWPGVDTHLDEVRVAQHLSLQPARGRTFFRGIRSLVSGSFAVAQGDGSFQETSFWDPLRLPELHLRDSREYAEALRAALLRAITLRLPAEGRIGTMLSSGFDSSGITALAAQALAKQNRPLVAYTSVPAHQVDASQILHRRFANEWPLAAKVAAMYPNIEHVSIRTDAADWWESLDTYAGGAAEPYYFPRNTRWWHAILRDSQRRGISTVLVGNAGNLTSSYDGSLGLLDLRRRGCWSELAKAMYHRRSAGQSLRSLLWSVWFPSAAMQTRLSRLRGRKMHYFFDRSFMRPEFYAGVGLPPLHTPLMSTLLSSDRSSARAYRFSVLTRGDDIGMQEAGFLRQFGVQQQDPTADRRMIELCLSIPDEKFAPGGIARDLYRSAMRNDLPADLLSEPLRGLQSSDFIEMFGEWLPEWRAEVDRLRCSPTASHCLDVERMSVLLDAWPGTAFSGDGASSFSRSAADREYNTTFGIAITMGRFLRRLEDASAIDS